MSGPTLQALVDYALEMRASPTIFHSLLKQVNHKQEVTTNDVAQFLSTQHRLDPLAVMYVSVSCLKEQTLSLRLSTVISHLRNATDLNQQLIVTAIVSQFREYHEFPLSSHDVSEVNVALTGYIQYLLDNKPSSSPLLEGAARLMAVLGLSLPEHLTASLSGEQNQLIARLAAHIAEKSPTLSEELISSLERFQSKKTRSQNTRQSISISSQGFSLHASFMKSSKLAKYIWLNTAIQTWSTHKATFLVAFEQFVKVKNSQNILNELIATSFEGYIVAQQMKDQSPYFAKNWELFLIKRLPLLIKDLKLKNAESSLVNALALDPKVLQAIKLQGGGCMDNNDDMFSSFPSTATDIRHEFVRSCIALQLLPAGAFETILKQDAAADGRRLQTHDNVLDEMGQIIDIEAILKKTLVDINTEFIPLEESGLLELLKSVEKMEGTKQVEFSKHIMSLVAEFIANDDASHLYRLSLALGLVPNCLHALIFHLSPTTFLKPIMNFIDSWQTNNDDVSFQDTYSAFGCIFLLFLLTVKEFGITLPELAGLKNNLEQDSFCINFLCSMGASSWKSPIGELNQHRSEVLSGWMTALFDSGGISDDLMRLSTVQECFELFPVIFQQAFVACKQGLTDVDTIKGGLEYFLQPFLLSTVVGILSWCEDYLWKSQDIELLVNLLKTLITPLELSGESVYIHRLIMSIFGSKLYQKLSDLDANSSPLRVDATVLSTLRQSIKPGKSNGFFEVDASSTTTHFINPVTGEPEISLSVVFQIELQFLLTWGQSASVSLYNHQFIKNMQKIMGVDGIIDCFVEQIVNARRLKKNVQLVLELSAFVFVIELVGYSADSRNIFLASFKNETVPTRPRDTLISGYCNLRALINKKKSVDESSGTESNEAFILFYEKILGTIQSLVPLD